MKKDFNEDDIRREFEAKQSASEKDINKILRKERKIMDMLKDVNLAKFFEYVILFFQLLHDYISGEYRGVSKRTIALIAGALAYLLCPADLIPDIIPIIGFVDDAAVLEFCIDLIKYELDNYKAYKDNSGLQVA